MNWMPKVVALLGLLIWTAGSLHAGSRAVEIGFVDATAGESTKEGKRLFELFVKDTQDLFLKHEAFREFPWEEGGVVRVLPADSVKGLFKKMLITDQPKQMAHLAEKHRVQDGIVVYEYDKEEKQVRLKVFSSVGKETLMLRLRLADEGEMKMSRYKNVRRGAVIALGTSIRFVP